MDHQTTGQRIADCRKKQGLSQEALGEKVGVSRQAISKWEADAAMPDIDKLIFLSKLFCVSVGWLLGVEEMSDPRPEAPQISEELLRKIEEIVLRYRPRKEKLSLGKKLLIAAVAALLLWSGATLLEQWNIVRNEVGYLSGQLRNNNQQNASILNRISGLDKRIDSINDTIEREAAVLASYEFQVNAKPGQDTAGIYLNAIPKTWNESWTATLSVRHDGSQSMSQTCAWDGSALIGSLKLNLLDGYECWLVIAYPDGSREQVPLPDETVENLKSATSITCDLGSGSLASWNLTDHTVYLHGYDLYLGQPTTMEPSKWIKAEYVLYHIREDNRTTADTDPLALLDEVSITQEFWTSGQRAMGIPEIESGDRLELWFEAELENGLSCAVKVDSWVFRQGQFLWDR